MDLADFLLARIAEDEEAARAAQRIVNQCEARLYLPRRWRYDLADQRTARLLATIYADHQDYQQEWRPW